MKSTSRRKVLTRAGWIGAALTVGLPALDSSSETKHAMQQPDTRKLKVIVAEGHPGDPE